MDIAKLIAERPILDLFNLAVGQVGYLPGAGESCTYTFIRADADGDAQISPKLDTPTLFKLFPSFLVINEDWTGVECGAAITFRGPYEVVDFESGLAMWVLSRVATKPTRDAAASN